MKRTRNPEQKRRNIIEATKRILRTGGFFTNFSLDRVAKEAGVSKGGLIHHFGSKEALVSGVAQDTIEQFEAKMVEALAHEEAGETGRFSRAYIRSALRDPQINQDTSPILLAFLRSENSTETVESRFKAWHEQATTDGLDEVTATIIRLAVDGLLYTEIIDAQPIDKGLRERVIARLESMTQP